MSSPKEKGTFGSSLSLFLLPFFFVLFPLMACLSAQAGEPGPAEKTATASSPIPRVSEMDLKGMRFELYKGRQYDLCQNYLALMHRVPVNPKESCELRYSFDDIAKKQGFREIEWTEVDPQDHREMLKMSSYHARGGLSDEMKKKRFSEERFENFMNSSPRLWHTTMDLNFDGKKEVVYRRSGKEGRCTNGPNVYFMFDSSKPYSQFSRKSGRHYVVGRLFYYKGRPYLHRGSVFSMITEPYGSGRITHEKSICSFRPENIFKGR